MAAVDMKSTEYYKSGRQLESVAKARTRTDARASCIYCRKETTYINLKKHADSCYLNPSVMRACEVCNKPVKNYKSSVTCSYSCSNTFFRDRRNVNCATTYIAICFRNHEKRCVICGEDQLVAVHHFDENRENNTPHNLVPMCPTHHGYMHSGLRTSIEGHVISYRNWWIAKKTSLEARAAADKVLFHGRVRLTRSTIPLGWTTPYTTAALRIGDSILVQVANRTTGR